MVRRVGARDGREVEVPRSDGQVPLRSDGDPPLHPWLPDGGDAGVVLAALGAVIATLRVRPGHVCLEIGAGTGNLAVTLAQMGCDTTYYGFSDGGTGLVARRARALAAAVDVIGGSWRDLPHLVDGRRFDFVLFDAALSRSADHVELFRMVRQSVLAPGGRLVLLAEPQWTRSSKPRQSDLPTAGSASADEDRRSMPVSRPGDLAAGLAMTGLVPEEFDVPFVAGGKIIVASRKH